MKTTSLCFLLLAFVCAGCATRYDMTLSNGSVITAKGKPRIDEKRHIIFFMDALGHSNAIPEFRVTQIAPHSLSADENQTFNPTVKK